jgi:hypothetical protein
VTTNFDELYKCAALADWIYARQGVDQAIQLTDIKQDLIVLNAGTALVETPTLRREDNDLYYSDRGFVGERLYRCPR